MNELLWQRMKDSNPHKRSQSPVCYHYTNPLNARAIIPQIWHLSIGNRNFFNKIGDLSRPPIFCFDRYRTIKLTEVSPCSSMPNS